MVIDGFIVPGSQYVHIYPVKIQSRTGIGLSAPGTKCDLHPTLDFSHQSCKEKAQKY
jgi:hypothetical protein